MRLDYHLDVADVHVPRFAVEAQERIGKLFTLATLVWNILDTKERVEIVFHGVNREDPGRRITAFRNIMTSLGPDVSPTFEEGPVGHVSDSSTHFQWLEVKR